MEAEKGGGSSFFGGKRGREFLGTGVYVGVGAEILNLNEVSGSCEEFMEESISDDPSE